MKKQALILASIIILSTGFIPQQNVIKKDFTLEMASGGFFKEVSVNLITDNFNKMDDDNFFIILTHGKDFMQAAFSKKGFDMEYKKDGIQYTSQSTVSKEKTLNLLIKYFNEDASWIDDLKWDKQ